MENKLKNVSKKTLSLLLSGALCTTIGCVSKKKDDSKVVNSLPVSVESKLNPEVVNVYVTLNNEEEGQVKIEYQSETPVVESGTKELTETEQTYRYVVANDNVKILDAPKGEKLSYLFEGQNLLLLSDNDENYYEVEYDGNSAYVSKKNTSIIKVNGILCNKDIPFLDNSMKSHFMITKNIVATGEVNVRTEPNTKCAKLGMLSKGDSLILLDDTDLEWYKVDYNGRVAYVFKKYAKVVKGYIFDLDVKDIVLTTRKVPIYDIDTMEEIKTLPRNEAALVYAQTESSYLVESIGTIGLIPKKYVQSLSGTCVIVDISSQMVELYDNYKLIYNTPCVTGKNSTPTYCGVYFITSKEYDVTWKDLNTHVQYFMPFNRREGFHDADSWRKKDFGKIIYKEKGSHGCVNLPDVCAETMWNTVEVGTPVLVKK